MELRDLELSWQELYVQHFDSRETYIMDMVGSLRGERNIGGRAALQFSSKNEDGDFIFLSVEYDSEKKFNYCLKWNDDREEWEKLGRLFNTNEWGFISFNRQWNTCAIILYSPERTVYLKDSIAQCLGEKYGGLLFKGKGIWDGDMLILKLDRGKRLQSYYENQKCYRYNKDIGEWEFFGMLLKNPNKKP